MIALKIERMADMFRLLGDPTRLQILLACLNDPIAVGSIAAQVNASPSLVSHHLRLLKAGRLVRGVRVNRQVFYQVADGHVAHMLTDMLEHAGEPHHASSEDDEDVRKSA
jgi:DNA-binding transcriptional ArsR family regulator